MVAPVIQAIFPAEVNYGARPFDLSVVGTDFEPGAEITLHGNTLLTTQTADNVLVAVATPLPDRIPPGGRLAVIVRNTAGNELSNALFLQVGGRTEPTCVTWVMDTGCDADWPNLDPDLQNRAEALAWDTIKVLTGGRVGSCPVTMRPCLTPPCNWCLGAWHWGRTGAGWMNPIILDGNWYNVVCGGDKCSCGRLCEIDFPGSVAEVLEVEIDGILIPAGLWRLDNSNKLVRQDGECWPSCQHLDRELGDIGTMGVRYVPGIVPDAAGLWAAGVLASEFAKACSGAKCRLPTSVTSIARQGVSMTMSTSLWADGLTGIREVDAYIYSVNPHGLRQPPSVWTPDLKPALHRWGN